MTSVRRPDANFREIPLPEPSLANTSALGDALRQRRTTREFRPDKLDMATLSDLLYAACGINRRDEPFDLSGRTDATASNSREIIVYCALEDAIYLYEPEPHALTPVVAGDHRALVIGPRQSRAGDHAPVRLIYVADVERLERGEGVDEPGLRDPDVQRTYYCVDCGIVAANVYLYAAGFHNCDRRALARLLPLKSGRRVLFGQTVGYPLHPLPAPRR